MRKVMHAGLLLLIVMLAASATAIAQQKAKTQEKIVTVTLVRWPYT